MDFNQPNNIKDESESLKKSKKIKESNVSDINMEERKATQDLTNLQEIPVPLNQLLKDNSFNDILRANRIIINLQREIATIKDHPRIEIGELHNTLSTIDNRMKRVESYIGAILRIIPQDNLRYK